MNFCQQLYCSLETEDGLFLKIGDTAHLQMVRNLKKLGPEGGSTGALVCERQ